MDESSLELIIMLFVKLFTGAITAAIAKNKHRSAVGWFFGGFFLDIIGIIIVAVLKDPEEERSRQEKQENENRRLREQLHQERMKQEVFRQNTTARLDAHDSALGLETRTLGGAPETQYIEGSDINESVGLKVESVSKLSGSTEDLNRSKVKQIKPDSRNSESDDLADELLARMERKS
jgi:hypothetical protein